MKKVDNQVHLWDSSNSTRDLQKLLNEYTEYGYILTSTQMLSGSTLMYLFFTKVSEQ